MYTVFVIDDEPIITRLVATVLKDLPAFTFSDPSEALKAIKEDTQYLFIIDYKMPGLNGLEFLVEIRKRQVHYKALLLTAFADKEILEKAINHSLIDRILEKPFDKSHLLQVVNELLSADPDDVRAIKQELDVLKKECRQIENIIGLDSGLIEVYKVVKAVAPIDYSILITGETGSGKELIADLIHIMSPRKNYPIVKLNCASFPDNLIESELFGYEKGAFTGAEKTKPGKIEAANKGTLFLDEIGDLKPELQAKLLRVIEDKVITRSGSNQEQKIDFRLIAATNIDIEKAMNKDHFRKELFYRLNMLPVKLPPLRERKEDISKLAQYIVSKNCEKMGLCIKEFSESAINLLKQYEWFGNIRELESVIVRALLFSRDSSEINEKTLLSILKEKKRSFDQAIDTIAGEVINENLEMKDIEKRIIKAIVKRFDNNVQQVVENTSFSKSTIYRALNLSGDAE